MPSMIHPSTYDPTAPYEPTERPDAAECEPSDPAWVAELSRRNPSPVSAADFAPRGDTTEHRAARAADDIPF